MKVFLFRGTLRCGVACWFLNPWILSSVCAWFSEVGFKQILHFFHRYMSWAVYFSCVAYLNVVRLKESNMDSLTPQFFDAIWIGFGFLLSEPQQDYPHTLWMWHNCHFAVWLHCLIQLKRLYSFQGKKSMCWEGWLKLSSAYPKDWPFHSS